MGSRSGCWRMPSTRLSKCQAMNDDLCKRLTRIMNIVKQVEHHELSLQVESAEVKVEQSYEKPAESAINTITKERKETYNSLYHPDEVYIMGELTIEPHIFIEYLKEFNRALRGDLAEEKE